VNHELIESDDGTTHYYIVRYESLKLHQLELEHDLITAHILLTGEVPEAQFLDGTNSRPG